MTADELVRRTRAIEHQGPRSGSGEALGRGDAGDVADSLGNGHGLRRRVMGHVTCNDGRRQRTPPSCQPRHVSAPEFRRSRILAAGVIRRVIRTRPLRGSMGQDPGRPSVRGASGRRLRSRRHPPAPRSPSSRARLAYLEALGAVSSNTGSVRAGGACRVCRRSIPAHWRRLIGERRRRTPPSGLAGTSLVMTQLPCPFGRW